jgi:hypothetical protein
MKTFISVLFGLSVAAGVNAQTPLLNSYPSARATLYLDFDGQYVTGTSWNWAGDINALPAGFTPDQITEVFNRVAEDYRVFNINITTDSNVYKAAPLTQRQRLIITPTYQWYGKVGGISFVGSFSWGDDTPGWVFSSLLGNSPKNVAEAASHEGGHTLGLQHQSTYSSTCVKTEYNGGAGTGEIGWAPIMGVGYYKNLTTWHYGTSTVGCTTYQDDGSIIAGSPNNFGYRPDDVGNTHTTATTVPFSSTGFSTSGVINNGTDKDVFKFTLTAPTYVQLSAVPQNVGANYTGANLDIKLSLLNYKADTLGVYNPADLVNAEVDTTLATGTYYVVVEGVSNANFAKTESVGMYTLAAATAITLPIRSLTLSGRVSSGVHSLNWVYQSDEASKEIDVQDSKDGIHFESLAQLNADNKSFSYKPLTSGTMYYRVRVVTTDDKSFYSNILILRENNDDNAAVRIMNTIVTNSVVLNSDKEYSYQLLDGTGRLMQRGQLVSGTNVIDVKPTDKGLLLLRVLGQSEGWTWKLIKQ